MGPTKLKAQTENSDVTQHQGQCHCGAVKFEFSTPEGAAVTICNCSICSMTGYEHVIVPKENLSLTGADNLTSYRFGTQAAEHLFCKICGVKPLYVPRSHPDSYSVNRRCVTSNTLKNNEIINFDGRNWESSISALRAKI